MDIVESILSLLKLLLHMFEVATDIAISNHRKLTAIFAFVFGACLIYFWKIDSIEQTSAFPLALFLISGIYLAYSFTKWVIDIFNS